MTNPTPVATTDARDALRARIDTAERRNAERTLADQAREAASSAADYTRANPLTVIGGAVVAGVIIGLLTRPGRQAAGKAIHSASDAISNAGSNAKSFAKRRTGIGQSIGDSVVAYGMTMIDEIMDTARAGQDRAGELGDAAGSKAKKLSASASDAADSAASSTRAMARKTRAVAADTFSDLKRRATR
ncbi:MAG: hypothetical protein GW858_10125 [Sphingomonadales bacterium]|nr:hypothetical protein [Sphingomonadales bacterium]NCQ21402.1 hypothetical protein [Sphingomonadales bacterium]NCT04189.1 hypothetical protein [Sphingomonadales bacterium]